MIAIPEEVSIIISINSDDVLEWYDSSPEKLSAKYKSLNNYSYLSIGIRETAYPLRAIKTPGFSHGECQGHCYH